MARITLRRLARLADEATGVSKATASNVFNLDALREVGIDTQAVPVFETLSDEATVHAALEEIFAAPAPPTAILAQSDRIAMIALRWLPARGWRCRGTWRSSASTACPRAQGRCRR